MLRKSKAFIAIGLYLGLFAFGIAILALKTRIITRIPNPISAIVPHAPAETAENRWDRTKPPPSPPIYQPSYPQYTAHNPERRPGWNGLGGVQAMRKDPRGVATNIPKPPPIPVPRFLPPYIVFVAAEVPNFENVSDGNATQTINVNQIRISRIVSTLNSDAQLFPPPADAPTVRAGAKIDHVAPR